MEKVIDINIYNRGNIKIVFLFVGIGFIIISAIEITAGFGKELETFDILKLIVYPLAGIINLILGFGYNFSRLLKHEKLTINDSSIFHDGFFNKSRINFEQIESIESRKQSLVILLTNAQRKKIYLTNWRKDKINELKMELNTIISTAHNNGQHK